MPSPLLTSELPPGYHYQKFDNGAELSSAIATWLAHDPVPFALVCGVAAKTDPGHWCGILSHNGQPVVAFAHTPPWPVIIASPHAVDADTVEVIWRVLHTVTPTVYSFNAPAAWAEALAQRLSTELITRQGVRLHKLHGSPRLPHAAVGHARQFYLDELSLLQQWLYDFSCEATPEDKNPWLSREHVAAMRKECWTWIVDNKPVALARAQRPFCGGWSIGPVYTPPAQRRHGYAGALVHALCEQLISEGTTYIALYTDLANPTSNKLYAAIGFEPILDQLRISWQ